VSFLSDYVKETGATTIRNASSDSVLIGMDISFKAKKIELASQSRNLTHNRDKVSFGIIHQNGNLCYPHVDKAGYFY
jgi:hypothetical protein